MVVTVGGNSYYMNKTLKSKWDRIKDGKLAQMDEDRVYVVDGRERAGKSLFTIQQAAYIDPTIINDLSRITFTPEETLSAIRKTKSTKKETKAIIFDEAFRGLSSKAALSKVNKKIVQAMMEMGQNNLVFFIVSPSIFLLEMYGAVLRSEALFHIVKDKNSRRRYFRAFNYKKKAQLYQIGIKKGWGYKVPVRLMDNFTGKYPGGDEFEAKYRAKKAKSVQEMGREEVKQSESDKKHEKERNILIYYLLENRKMKEKEIVELFSQYGVDRTQQMINIIRKKMQEIPMITQKQKTNINKIMY